jgi:hypothetical protein
VKDILDQVVTVARHRNCKHVQGVLGFLTCPISSTSWSDNGTEGRLAQADYDALRPSSRPWHRIDTVKGLEYSCGGICIPRKEKAEKGHGLPYHGGLQIGVPADTKVVTRMRECFLVKQTICFT